MIINPVRTKRHHRAVKRWGVQVPWDPRAFDASEYVSVMLVICLQHFAIQARLWWHGSLPPTSTVPHIVESAKLRPRSPAAGKVRSLIANA